MSQYCTIFVSAHAILSAFDFPFFRRFVPSNQFRQKSQLKIKKCGIAPFFANLINSVNQMLPLTVFTTPWTRCSWSMTCHRGRLQMRKDNGSSPRCVLQRHMLNLMGNMCFGIYEIPQQVVH
jgi:hypothetical protein